MFERISALCRRNNISIAELERMAGLSPRTIYKWNENVPSVEKVLAVASVFGITVEELVGKDSKIEETAQTRYRRAADTIFTILENDGEKYSEKTKEDMRLAAETLFAYEKVVNVIVNKNY